MPCAKINVPGDVRKCSIPNITGWYQLNTNASSFYHSGDLIGSLVSGAFCYRAVKLTLQAGVARDSPGGYNVAIDASRVSPIYSEASTVQPPAFQTLIIIKF